MTVKRIRVIFIKLYILMLLVILLAAGVISCGKPSIKTTDTTYKLTHTTADVEYILSWDLIVSRCPDIGEYDKQEAFVHRGESKQTIPGAPVLKEDSPAAWVSIRFVNTQSEGNNTFHNFGSTLMFFDTDEYLEEYIELMEMQGLDFHDEDNFVTAVLENGSPLHAVQLYIAGDQFFMLLADISSSDKSPFFGKKKLTELLPTIKNNISSLEVTPLPPRIPERTLIEPKGQQNTLIEVKCNGEEYNLVVKPDNAVVLLATSIREQNVGDLMSSGLIQEIYEIGRNKASEDTQLNVRFAEFYKNTQLSEGEAWPSCKVVFIVVLPSENLVQLLDRLISYGAYYSHVLSNNTRVKEVRLSFSAEFAE